MSYEKDNERFLDILSSYLNFYEDDIKKEDVLAVSSVGVDEKTAFALLIAERFGVDTGGKDRKFFNDYFLLSIEKLNVSDYYSDEFFKLKLCDNRVIGDFLLSKMTYPAYRGFVRDDFLYLKDGRVIPRIGFFDKDYVYPAVSQGGREWMTLLPNEINSQKKYIDEAFGKVAAYGLGLGYYALKVALKDSVTSVTVVDIDNSVIDLFSKEILPQFPLKARNKIKLVNADALGFSKGLKAGDFDYIYVDVWHDVSDAVGLIKAFKAVEKYCPTARYGYWIEDTVRYYLADET
ncbi:MAG: hypothetical protein J5762_02610 [Clostridia bacterium]|nr:hypothetical protein [Clostridia bacterium]